MLGIEKLSDVRNRPSREWTFEDYPDLKKLSVFQK
jgi:hypothetical protein